MGDISIPLKSGLIVISWSYRSSSRCSRHLNPLEIGSNCNLKIVINSCFTIRISIPLKSGLIVMQVQVACLGTLNIISIPLKSGLIVIRQIRETCKEQSISIPLKSGLIVMNNACSILVLIQISIPLKSGLIVIIINDVKNKIEMESQSP